MSIPELTPLERWRLLLGEPAEGSLGGLSGDAARMDAALRWLYGRDQGLAERDVLERGAGLEASALSVPEWINEVGQLFPKETVERLERDAIERFHIEEVVTSPEVLERVEPNPTLLEAVLRTKHLMNPQVLSLARQLVARVVAALMERFRTEVRFAFHGTRDRRRPSRLRAARNFDFDRTIRANLKRWSPEKRRLFLESPRFFSRSKRFTERWQFLLLVDQSGSMVSSVIHSAVTAACLWGLPGMDTRLVAFDTEVVDLTADVTDPVELLMKVQLGGGTNIGKALAYAAQRIEAPRRAIVVLISDLCEGATPEVMLRVVGELAAQGTTVLALAALDPEAQPAYDRAMGQRLADRGAHVGAMTPGQLAAFIAERVKG